MTTKTWKIEALEAKPQDGELTNVAVTAHWRLNGEDAGHHATVYGSIALGPVGEPFTPFAELTEAQVIAWVQEQMGEDTVAAHEAAIDAQIAALVTPAVVTMALPWAA